MGEGEGYIAAQRAKGGVVLKEGFEKVARARGIVEVHFGRSGKAEEEV